MKFQELMQRNSAIMFDSFKAGNFTMSVQGSSGHYSTPRISTYAGDYTHMEVAVFENGLWVNPKEDERFSELHNELQEHWESGNNAVGCYVPVEVIQRLYDFCVSYSEPTESAE